MLKKLLKKLRPYKPFSEKPGVESKEISEWIVLDCDEAGALAGIDIDYTSEKVQLK